MNNKLPVVATNHGGPVEIIENKGYYINICIMYYKNTKKVN